MTRMFVLALSHIAGPLGCIAFVASGQGAYDGKHAGKELE